MESLFGSVVILAMPCHAMPCHVCALQFMTHPCMHAEITLYGCMAPWILHSYNIDCHFAEHVSDSKSIIDPTDYVSQLKTHMQCVRLTPPRTVQRNTHVPQALATATCVCATRRYPHTLATTVRWTISGTQQK